MSAVAEASKAPVAAKEMILVVNNVEVIYNHVILVLKDRILGTKRLPVFEPHGPRGERSWIDVQRYEPSKVCEPD